MRYLQIVGVKPTCLRIGGKSAPAGTRLILSHHDYEGTPDTETLQGVLARMVAAGADVPKIACVANDVADSARMLQLAAGSSGAHHPPYCTSFAT